jgi:hypothetical protein
MNGRFARPVGLTSMSPLGGGFNWSLQHTNLLAEDGVWAMKQRRRIYYSAAQRSEIWDRWQAGRNRHQPPTSRAPVF